MEQREQVPQSSSEKTSFVARVEAQTDRLRRIQMLCLLTLFCVFFGSLNQAYAALDFCLKIVGMVAVVGMLYCYAQTSKIACPKCHKKIGYLLLDPNYAKTNGAILLPKEGLPADRHQCPYCHANWELPE